MNRQKQKQKNKKHARKVIEMFGYMNSPSRPAASSSAYSKQMKKMDVTIQK